MSRPTSPLRLLFATFLLLVFTPGASVAQNALAFDGADDYVAVGDPLNPTTALTIEAWIKVIDATSAGRIVSNRGSAGGYDVDVFDDGSRVDLRLAFDGGQMATADFSAHVGIWTHVAASWGGPGSGRVRLYINGSIEAQNDFAGAPTASVDNLTIGRMSAWFYFHGSIDEVRIWDAELAPATIQARMNWPVSNTHPNWGSLMAAWSFDEGAGQTAASAVASPAMDGALGSTAGADTGDPTWTADAAPLPVPPNTFARMKAAYRDGR
ncbi:LamG domain-containing protein [bacterium]|nr:LamG domain-containing protein [bacterium]